MRYYRILAAAFLITSLSAAAGAQHAETPQSETPVHYRVYDGEGNPSSFDAVVAKALDSDVILVGEEHNDPIAHWLQVELLKNLLEGSGDRPVALSLEMFERDVQHVVDEYLAGKEQVLAWLIGRVMRATRGKANPQLAREVLKDRLDARRG